jgi:uncharacterized protein YkwD
VIASEIALIDLINAHRTGLGLDALQFDRLLTQCARGHSRHHHEHNLFEGHVNPESHSYVGRLLMNGIDFDSAGENVAYNFILPSTVFQEWLNSSENRANIERMCFIRIGVGLHEGVWTANFAR